MSLRLGQIPNIVVSSSEAAEKFLKTHDTVFIGRPNLKASKYFSYGSKRLVYVDYGPYWRNMRKVCTLHLLSVLKVESFTPLREQEVELVARSLKKTSMVVDLSEVVEGLLQDIVFKIVLGGIGSKDGKHDLKGPVQEGMKLIGTFNVAEYVPWLRPLDLQVWTGLHGSSFSLSLSLSLSLELKSKGIQFWKSVCYLNLIR